MKMPKIEVFEGTCTQGRHFFWRLVGANGECQCISQAYPTRWNARRGAKAARRNARFARLVDLD